MATLTINNTYVVFFDVPDQCGTNPVTPINLTNHVSVVQTSNNTNVPVLANGFSIVAYSAGALAMQVASAPPVFTRRLPPRTVL